MSAGGYTVDPIEQVAANSFRNFHAKGLDYLCLQRSPSLTVKAYFFDGLCAQAPEVVCPHDHRYPFATTVVAGEMTHTRYGASSSANADERYQRFAWRTPLNGGDGFTWDGEASLRPRVVERYRRGTYWCRHDEVHTIAVKEPGSIIILVQLADVVPIDQPTHTYVPGSDRAPPTLDGLYDRMTIDHALSLIARLPA